MISSFILQRKQSPSYRQKCLKSKKFRAFEVLKPSITIVSMIRKILLKYIVYARHVFPGVRKFFRGHSAVLRPTWLTVTLPSPLAFFYRKRVFERTRD